MNIIIKNFFADKSTKIKQSVHKNIEGKLDDNKILSQH